MRGTPLCSDVSAACGVPGQQLPGCMERALPHHPPAAGAAAGSGNASRFWEEFKPYKRENKKTRARDASTASYGSSSFSSMDEPAAAAAAEGPAQQPGRGSGGGGDRWAGMPTAGAVVEYPLSQLVQDELQDGRSHGVGLLVGRNIDR